MTLRILITALILITVWPAFGHEIVKGPHGGRVVDTGQVHVELVAKDSMVEVYLTDNADKAVAAVGYKGVAILLISGKSQRIVLEPTSENRLTGKVSEALVGPLKGAVLLTMPDGKTTQAKFD